MTRQIAAFKSAFHTIASGDREVMRAVVRIGAKGALLAVLALMIAAYAVSVSQSVPAPPEPLPARIYS